MKFVGGIGHVDRIINLRVLLESVQTTTVCFTRATAHFVAPLSLNVCTTHWGKMFPNHNSCLIGWSVAHDRVHKSRVKIYESYRVCLIFCRLGCVLCFLIVMSTQLHARLWYLINSTSLFVGNNSSQYPQISISWSCKCNTAHDVLHNIIHNPQQCYVGLTVFCGIFFTFTMNDEIFCRILVVPQNIVMDLNNVKFPPFELELSNLFVWRNSWTMVSEITRVACLLYKLWKTIILQDVELVETTT